MRDITGVGATKLMAENKEYSEMWKEVMGYELPEQERVGWLGIGETGFDPEEAPFQRKKNQSMLRALGVAAGNVPHSLGKRFEELGAVVQDPVAAAEGIASLGKGVGKWMFEKDEEKRKADPDVELARQAWGEFKGSFGPEQLQEDPTAAAANIASVMFPGIKGLQVAARGAGAAGLAGTLGKAAKVADIASDPAVSAIVGAGKGAGAAARRGVQFGGKVGAEVLGITTGRESGPIREAFQSGIESVRKDKKDKDQETPRDAFLRAVSDKAVSEDTVVKVGNLLRDEKARLGQRIGDVRQQMRENPLPVDISDIKQEIFGEQGLISDFGVEVRRGTDAPPPVEVFPGLQSASRSTPDELDFSKSTVTGNRVDAARAAAKSALNDLFRAGDTVFAHDLDAMKKALQDFTLTTSGEAETLVHKASRALRRKLYDEVPGYAEAFKDFDDLSTFLEDMKRRISLNVDEPFTKASAGAVRTALGEDKDTAFRAVQKLEEKFGSDALPMRAEVAGQALSRDVPSGLVGRSALLTGVGVIGGLGGAFVDPNLLWAIGTLPAFFPAFVGRRVSELGVGARVAKETVDSLKGMLDYAKVNKIPVTEAMTVAQLVERITDDDPERRKASLLQQIGSASLVPGQTAQVRPRKLNEPGLSLGDPFAPSR